MIILGLDSSKNGSGVVIAKTDKDFHLLDIDFLSFTQTKKYSNDKVLLHHKKNSFSNDLSKIVWTKESIRIFIDSFLLKHSASMIDFAAIEDYSFASMGRTEDKAEMAGNLKILLAERYNASLRKYSPKSIKKYSTQSGNADKTLMCETYIAELKDFLSLGDDLEIVEKYNDLVDAYFIMRMLQSELKAKNNVTDNLTKIQKEALKKYDGLVFEELHHKYD
jgi:hypothetical protein